MGQIVCAWQAAIGGARGLRVNSGFARMAQLFPQYTNTLARIALPCLALGFSVVAWAVHAAWFSSYATEVNTPVEQPVPFSHQHHVAGLGIDCRYCHTSVETSAFAGLPPTETCMTCHSQVWRDAPILGPVRESWTTGRRLRWKRVHDLPDYVYFNHSIHVQEGIACVSCHGRVDRMPLMAKQHSLYMRWCLDCHRAPERHVQPMSEVFVMRDEPAQAAAASRLASRGELRGESPPIFERGRQAVREKAVRDTRLEDCSICHR
ncbi:MAG: hypothetical protein QOE70_5629 [Chthoniobacter sp.]|nr:hypothetical protein [Chthoniobacter sp.]